MLTVRLHTQAGLVWVLFRCCICSEVQKRTLRDTMIASPECKRCGTRLDIAHALAERNHVDDAGAGPAGLAHQAA